MIIETLEKRKQIPDMKDIGWGEIFTDHMLEINYENSSWGEVIIKPYGVMEDVEPSNCTFHYGASVFEGAKTFKCEDNSINLFRPFANLARINRSQERLCIPQFTKNDKQRILEGLIQMLKFDKDWIPSEPNSLYLRHFTISSENFVGLRPSKTYKSMIIMTPVGQYLGGFRDIKIWIPEEYTRAVKGGIGSAKASGNYSGTLKPVEIAHKMGYDQCIYLTEGGFISEASAANVFFVINDEIITPKLNDTILAGITRDSIITLAKDHGFVVKEVNITIDDLIVEHNRYKLQEAFLCGTAATIIPISELYYKEDTIRPIEKIGEFTEMMYKKLTDLQYGRVKDERGWITKIN